MLRFVDTKYKLATHVVQVIVTVVVLILAGARLATLPNAAPRSRANTMAIGMSAKSLVIIGYQLCAEHVARLHKYKSLKANLILNSLEIVFWSAVTFLVMQASTKFCVGVSCGLGWAVMALAISQSSLASYAALMSFVEFRQSRRPKVARSMSTISPESSTPMGLSHV